MIKSLGKYLALFATSFCFIALFSPTTSFINTRWGADSAIFRYTGHSLTQGLELYTDIWDHKGPTLFALQWFEQVIYPGRIGIFIVQVLLLFATLCFLVNLAKRLLSLPGVIAVVAIFLGFTSIMFEGGNLTEEYSLPFIAIVLYGTAVALLEPKLAQGKWGTIMFPLMGFAFAFVFFLRANNAFPIFGLFVGYFVTVLIRRQQFWRPFLYSIAGFAALTLFICIWFMLRGTFNEMMEATFWFNFKYSESSSGAVWFTGRKSIYLLGGIASIAVPAIGGIVDWLVVRSKRTLSSVEPEGQRSSLIWLSFGVGIMSMVAVMQPSTSYMHYLVLAGPSIAFGLVLILQVFSTKWQSICMVLALVAATAWFWTGYRSAENSTNSANDPYFVAQVEDVLQSVPDDQIDQVFGWNMPARYFLAMDVLPMHRFYTMQTWWGHSDSAVLDEVVGFVEEDQPQWILVPAAGFESDQMQQVVDSLYVQVAANDDFLLYQLQ